MYNKSSIQGIFANIWKRTFELPLYKDKDLHEIVKYRPISIFNTLDKVIDAVF